MKKHAVKLTTGLSAFALLIALGLNAPVKADMDSDWSTFDADGDGMVSDSEFETGLFDTWDADDDSLIAENEWGDHDLFGDDVGFGDYDANTDGFWDENEFGTAYNESGIYENYDSAGDGIQQEEFATFYDDAGDAGLFDL